VAPLFFELAREEIVTIFANRAVRF